MESLGNSRNGFYKISISYYRLNPKSKKLKFRQNLINICKGLLISHHVSRP